MPEVLELEALRRTFGEVVALDGLTFTVPDGVLFGFVGRNGSGKTTAMRIVCIVVRLAAVVYERAVLQTGGRVRLREVLRSA